MESNIFGNEAIQVVVTGTRNTSDSIGLSVSYLKVPRLSPDEGRL